MRQDRDRRLAHTDARDRDEAQVATPQPRALPDVAEHEVQDASVLVRRVRRQRGHEVHVTELGGAASGALVPVVAAELVDVVGERRR